MLGWSPDVLPKYLLLQLKTTSNLSDWKTEVHFLEAKGPWKGKDEEKKKKMQTLFIQVQFFPNKNSVGPSQKPVLLKGHFLSQVSRLPSPGHPD